MKAIIIGLFGALFLGALFFSQERVLFADASFILFRIINLDSLQIQEYRCGSFITQLVPLLASRIQLPLSWIVLFYSASFNLFYLIVAAVLIFRFKEYRLALLMAFYYVLFVSDSYFWTNNEVHQGIAWMFLFFAVIFYLGREKKSPVIMIPFFIVLGFLSVFTHPLMLFAVSFLWLFFLLQKELCPFNKTWSIFFSAILLGLCISRFIVSASGDHYDSERLLEVSDLSFKKIRNAFFSPMAKEIFKRSFSNYWLVPVLFLVGLYSALKLKKYKVVVLTICFCLAYFIAVCLTFHEFISFYTESEWMPLSIIATAPFVYFTLPQLKPRTASFAVAGIFLVRLVYIGFAAEKFVQRKDWLYATLETMREKNIKKAIIYENEENKKILLMNWSTPTESIIASSLLKDIPNLTFVVDSRENIAQRIPPDPLQMISSFESLSYNNLNTRYFSFDTKNNYQVMTADK